MVGFLNRSRGWQAVFGLKFVLGGILMWNTKDNLTAFAGGGQTGGVPITEQMTRFTTVATGGDSSKLPKSQPGMSYTITNAAAANSMNVFPFLGDQVNALGANTAFALAAGKTCEFVCYTAGQWHTLLSA